MIKIKSLQVKKFKSLIDTKIEEFGTVNMFYGFNNSGKSNVFKFLKILFDKKYEGTKVRFSSSDEDAVSKEKRTVRKQMTNFWNGNIWNEPFLFTNNVRKDPITFTIELLVNNEIIPLPKGVPKGYLGKNETVIKLNGSITSLDYETSEFKITESFINGKKFHRHEDQVDYFFENTKDKQLTKQVGESILNLFNNLILFIDTDRNFTSEVSLDVIDEMNAKNFKNSVFELNINAEKNEQYNSLIQFLSTFDFSKEAKEKLGKNVKSFPFKDITEIGFAKFDNELEIMLKNENGRFPLKNYGTGIQQFLFLLTKISLSKSQIVIVEELELNLSILYQTEMLRFLKSLMPKSYSQLLFSSHSPFFTQKNVELVDVVQHVQIGLVNDGSTIDSHTDTEKTIDKDSGESYFSLLYA